MKKGIQPWDKSDWSGWMRWHKSRGFRRVTWAVIDGNPVHFSRLSAHFPFEAKKKDILCQTELVPHCQSASSPVQTILAPSSPAALASWRGAKQLRCENRKQSVGRKTRLGVACPVRSGPVRSVRVNFAVYTLPALWALSRNTCSASPPPKIGSFSLFFSAWRLILLISRVLIQGGPKVISVMSCTG